MFPIVDFDATSLFILVNILFLFADPLHQQTNSHSRLH